MLDGSARLSYSIVASNAFGVCANGSDPALDLNDDTDNVFDVDNAVNLEAPSLPPHLSSP